MTATLRTVRSFGLDRLAIGLSGLCMVHCLATSVLLALAASAGGLLLAPWIHEVGLSLAIAMGGRVWATSLPGAGAAFHVALPVA